MIAALPLALLALLMIALLDHTAGARPAPPLRG